MKKIPRTAPNRFPYFLFAIFLALEVGVFLSHKAASINSNGDGWEFYWQLLHQPWIWLAFLLSAMQFYFWTAILNRLDLSLAYSISSLSYPLTMIASTFLFEEHLSLVVWAGAGLITLGVMILGLESHE